ncbi:helix-turn-helix domain-containing protein [Thermomonospora echinospora]|nr:response regulator transcription factor [Thermomonospora echinospora]
MDGYNAHCAFQDTAWAIGDRLRLVPQVPYQMVLADRRVAAVPKDGRTLYDGLYLIRDAAAVAALRGASRSLWALALRPSRPGAAPPAHLAPVLTAMLTEPSDEAACRRLGLAPRTYSRRVAELLATLGVTNRFQAGAAAARLGWL